MVVLVPEESGGKLSAAFALDFGAVCIVKGLLATHVYRSRVNMVGGARPPPQHVELLNWVMYVRAALATVGQTVPARCGGSRTGSI
jgi:hypothetical protein